MINSTRQELLRLLTELSANWPELRFGQLIVNLATSVRGPLAEAPWDVEDEELIQAVKEHLDDFRARQASVA